MKVGRLNQAFAFHHANSTGFEVEFDSSQPGRLANLLFINLAFGLRSGLSGRLNV